LRQVLINILSNAVKYNTSTEPRIDIEGRSEGATVRIDIRDNSGGITREEASTVFEKNTPKEIAPTWSRVRDRGCRSAGRSCARSAVIWPSSSAKVTAFFRLTFGPESPAGDA